MKGSDCVVLVTQKKVKDRLIDPSSVTNIYKISNNVSCVTVGPTADCNSVIARARQEAADFQYKYGYSIPCAHIAKRMADLAQESTQYAGRRSMAVSLIFGAVEKSSELQQDDYSAAEGKVYPQLYRVDLAGSFFGYSACAAGAKEQEAISLLEKKLKESPANSRDQTAQMALEVLQTCVGADFKRTLLKKSF